MPGTLYPVDGPRTRGSAAEVKLYEALRAQLPDGWTAWHSLRLRTADRSEGEGDFVIADPARGLLVLEVKGGRIELQGGHWLQNGRRLDKAPRQQALGVVRGIIELIRAQGIDTPLFGVASAFPDTEFTAPPSESDLVGLVLGQRDLAWLGRVLPEVMARALPDRPPCANMRWVKAIHALWGETWVPTVSLNDQADAATRRLIELDDAQRAVLDLAGDNPSALVEGGAGSGKTIVARELAVRRARAGQRVLYLCFTDALAGVTARSLASVPNTSAAPIRRYARELLEKSGHNLAAPTADFWNEVSYQAASAALPQPAERPDLVIVDEAQDFEPSDWMLIEELTRGRALWAFTDPRQRFWTDREIPPALFKHATRLRLPAQHRTPPAITALADAYAGGPMPTSPPPPEVLRLVVSEDPLDRVRHELDTLRKQGARPGDIAVLSLTGRDRSKLLASDKIGSHRVVPADSPEAATAIVADTFLRFKGLERPYVVITEPLVSAHSKHALRMYLALTRATVGAVVVCDASAVASDSKLASLGRGPLGNATC